MEHPVFSLSTKPDHRVRRYEHGDVFVEVKPSSDGLATVHDRDILIYCISQLVTALNAGQPVSPVLHFKAHDLLRATNRMTSGEGYAALKAALERLAGTRISTNIKTGGKEVFETFGLIERARIVREKFQHMPDYSVTLESEDMVLFRSRGSVPVPSDDSAPVAIGHLKPETYALARNAAPGWDVYYLEREWRDWVTEHPRDPDAAFIGFCRKCAERRGRL